MCNSYREHILSFEINGRKNNKYIKVYFDYQNSRSINIHELAYLTKIWAFKQGYMIKSNIIFDIKTNNFEGGCLIVDINSNETEWINAKTEPIAIFESGLWILNKQGENNGKILV